MFREILAKEVELTTYVSGIILHGYPSFQDARTVAALSHIFAIFAEKCL
jgi:hypothetical protein